MHSRRTFLAATSALLAAPIMARAADPDPRLAPRTEGSATAKNVVEEWFSFTCPHCARFASETYPEVKSKLIDTGKLRWVFREYTRNKLDMAAGLVARSLPPSRYLPFVDALFASQAQWAFNQQADPMDELAKMAALAGMPRDLFNKVTNDEGLRTAMLAAQTEAEQKYNIDSTPTFIINGKAQAGEMPYDRFAALMTT
ncbi:MAG: thioredoxin domain-containing protein [Rhodospirillales bacterium]